MKRLIRVVCVSMLAVMVLQTAAMAYPGQEFSSMDKAAKDFGKLYNAQSIRAEKEYGASIYRKSNGKYSYTVPTIGNRDSVSIPQARSWQGTAVSMVHSHANSDVYHVEELFSVTDYTSTIKAGFKYVYVVTPEGYLKRGEPKEKKLSWYQTWFMKNVVGVTVTNVTNVSSDMPHDRYAAGQWFLYKHWFGRRCANCAN